MTRYGSNGTSDRPQNVKRLTLGKPVKKPPMSALWLGLNGRTHWRLRGLRMWSESQFPSKACSRKPGSRNVKDTKPDGCDRGLRRKIRTKTMTDFNEVEFHPFCENFPGIGPDEMTELIEDIRKNGVREPVVFFQGKILDGRHRYRA